jgi:hypothetical protein
MDKLTDMLSTFFVTGKQAVSKKIKKSRDEYHSDNVSRQSSHQTQTEQIEIMEPPESIEPKESKSVNLESTDKETSNTTNTTDKTNTKTTEQNSEQTFTDSEDKPATNSKLSPKRYILRAIDMYRKNIMIVNNDKSENMAMLGDLLHTFSLMNKVEEIYQPTVYVVTPSDYRKCFKKMLLENPYLYFTDFKIKQSLGKQKLQELKESDKRTIVIVQFEDMPQIVPYLELLSANLQLIVLGKVTSQMVKLYQDVGEKPNKLLLHKKEKLKSLQKLFFERILKQLCGDVKDMDFNDYFQQVNADTYGIRYIVIKNDELRYY